MNILVAVNERGKRIGENHPRAKLLDSEVDQVFALREAGFTLAEIGRKLDMSKEGIWKIVQGYRRGQSTARFVKVSVSD